MHSDVAVEYVQLYSSYLALMVLCVAFCGVAEAVRLAKRERATAKTVIGRCIIIGNVVWCVINIIGYDVHPKIKMAVLVLAFAVSTYLLLSVINTKGIAVMLAAVIFLVFVLGCYLFDDAAVNTKTDEGSYVCVYSKWTGIGPTHVYYFERHFAFMKTRASLVADHGILLVSWEDVPNTEPIEIYRFEQE